MHYSKRAMMALAAAAATASKRNINLSHAFLVTAPLPAMSTSSFGKGTLRIRNGNKSACSTTVTNLVQNRNFRQDPPYRGIVGKQIRSSFPL